jgi:EAL domain
VKAVIGMARGLKLRVIAEGVENLEELAFLRAYRCDEAQGYYFSRPVPAEQFATLLAIVRRRLAATAVSTSPTSRPIRKSPYGRNLNICASRCVDPRRETSCVLILLKYASLVWRSHSLRYLRRMER